MPLDLGGRIDSTIMPAAYRELREHLGLGPGRIRVADACQQTALVEEDVREALGIDTCLLSDEPAEW